MSKRGTRIALLVFVLMPLLYVCVGLIGRSIIQRREDQQQAAGEAFRQKVQASLAAVIEKVRNAADEERRAILDKVAEQYKALETYETEGTVSVDVEMNGCRTHTETSFSMKLKKPKLYLITWEQKDLTMPSPKQSGAPWNAGNQPFLYKETSSARGSAEMPGDETAFAAAEGMSHGAAHTIPSLFFPSLALGPPLPLTNAALEKIEKLDGEECCVISGSSPTGVKEIFWISTQSYLIRQFSYSFEPVRNVPADADTGDRVSVEGAKTQGWICEHYLKISTPELTSKDFEFRIPEPATPRNGT